VVTYGELKARVDSLAAGLHHFGLGEHEVIAVFSPNHLEYGILAFAALRLGACVTTANPTYTVEELKFQLEDSKARVVVTIPELVETALKAMAGTKVTLPVCLWEVNTQRAY